MIRTVIRNILSNAIKFTHQGGKVEIFAKIKMTRFILKYVILVRG